MTRPPAGDGASVLLAAAALRREIQLLGPYEKIAEVAELQELAGRLVTVLDRYGEELRRAEHGYAAAERDVERNAALALAGRARRRLQQGCEAVVAAARA